MTGLEWSTNFDAVWMVEDITRLVGDVGNCESTVVKNTFVVSGIGFKWKMTTGAKSQFLF